MHLVPMYTSIGVLLHKRSKVTLHCGSGHTSSLIFPRATCALERRPVKQQGSHTDLLFAGEHGLARQFLRCLSAQASTSAAASASTSMAS